MFPSREMESRPASIKGPPSAVAVLIKKPAKLWSKVRRWQRKRELICAVRRPMDPSNSNSVSDVKITIYIDYVIHENEGLERYHFVYIN